MDGVTWQQSSLAVVKGGLGTRLLEELALHAFLASSYSTRALFDLILTDNLPEANLRTESACSMWLDDLQRISASDVFLPGRGIQAAWDESITERRRQNFWKTPLIQGRRLVSWTPPQRNRANGCTAFRVRLWASSYIMTSSASQWRYV
jgi:hypothetical protein